MGNPKKIIKAPVKAVKKIAKSSIGKIALPIVAGAALGPAGLGLTSALGGAAIGAGATTLAGGGNIKDALLAGGLSYAGGKIGGKLLPDTFGQALSPSNTLGPYSLGNSLGSFASNAIGNQIANTGIGTTLGSYAGNSLADSISNPMAFDMGSEGTEDTGGSIPGNTPFSPTRQEQIEAPTSLSGFSNLTDNQLSTNLATQGVYGGGLGPQEQSYFTNMINRRLVDESGNVDSDFSDINPIENSYLSQIGLGGYSNPKSLLEAISKWKAA